MESIKTALTAGADPLANVVVSNPTPVEEPKPSTAYQQEVNRMQEKAYAPPSARATVIMQPPRGSSDSDSMFAMMQFLGMQQQISAKQQHQQMMLQMEQRRLDQQENLS